MSDTNESNTSLMSAILTVLIFGVIGTSVVAILLQTTTEAVTFDLNIIFNILSDISNVVSYGIVVLGFAIGGLIGGVRTKNPEKGFLAGFFGSFLTGLIAFLLTAVDEFVAALETFNFNFFGNITTDYIIGMIGIMAAASITGWGAGKATFKEKAPKKIAKSKIKSWDSSRKWNCTNCGSEIPPGRVKCPNCGRAAF